MGIKKIHFTVFITLLPILLLGQQNIIFKHYSTQDGLSHGSIVNIIRDAKGFMWFATWDGLNRFDGHNFKVYKSYPGDGSPLSSNRIDLMVEDSIGNLWLKTYDGRLFRFNIYTEKFEDILHSVVGNENFRVVGIQKFSQSDIFIVTENSGVFRINFDKNGIDYRLERFCANCANYPIASDKVIHLFEDNKNHLWFIFPKGLSVFKFNKNTKEYRCVDSQLEIPRLSEKQITSYFSEGVDLFLGTNDGEVLYWKLTDHSIQSIGLKNSDVVSRLYVDKKKRLYVGTESNGLMVFNTISKKLLAHYYNSEFLNSVENLYEDSKGQIWISSGAVGIVKLDPEKRTIKHYYQDVGLSPLNRIITKAAIVEVANKKLWLSLNGGGFGYYNPLNEKVEYFFNKPGSTDALMSNIVPIFYVDSTNVLWLSTYNKGIEKIILLEDRFNLVQPEKGHSQKLANEVRALYEDAKKNLWVSTKAGYTYVYKPGTSVPENITLKYNLVSTMVYAISEDQDGNIWLGTKGNGLIVVNTSKPEKYTFSYIRHEAEIPNSLSNNDIYSVLPDSKGDVWVGSFGGGLNLLKKDNKGYRVLNSSNYFTNYPFNIANKIRQIKEDHKGNIWLATTEGLVFFNPNNTERNSNFILFQKEIDNNSSLGNNNVYCIKEDNNGQLWFGTLGGGLSKLVQYPNDTLSASFKSYNSTNGMASDVIFSIEVDHNNDLWMSSENGIIKFNSQSGVFNNYNQNDGLLSNSFSEAASCLRENGELCFGAFDGFYHFKPYNFTEKERKVNIELTDFQIFNQPVKQGMKGVEINSSISTAQLVELDHNQNVFSIEYTGLDYWVNNKFSYQYILEGYEENWHRVKDRRMATYTKVPPGEYKFMVKFDNPGLMGNVPRELKIIVQPPFWKTTWAYIIYIIVVLLLLETGRRLAVTIIKLRNNVVVEKELTQMKLKFFTNISHELRTPLALILGPVQEISRKEKLTDLGKGYLDIVERNTRKMLRLINQLLDFRKIQQGSIELKLTYVDIKVFIEDIYKNFTELAREKEIQFYFRTKVDGAHIWIDEEKIESVIYNLLSNAFKFTQCGNEVVLELNENPESVEVSVSDTGRGIPEDKQPLIFKRFANIGLESKDQAGTGIGLSLSKEFVGLHNGKISFTSSEGKGSRFVMLLFKQKEHFDLAHVSFIEKEPDKDESDEDILEEVSIDKGKSETRILVVEDNMDLLGFIKDLLKESYTVYEAIDGEQGIAKAKEIKPDLIISDIMMPKVDGLTLLSKLKDNFDTSHIPIVLLTAKSSIESKLEGLKYGADAYITKPFNSLYLIGQIDNLLLQRKKLVERYTGMVKLMDISDDELIVTDRDSEFLNKVVQIIEENLADVNFKVSVLSRQMGMGRTNFFNKIKGLTGLSPIDFVKEFKLKKAIQLLESGNYNVSEVSYMSGFSDPGYFSRCFKEKYKVAPSKFYKMNK